jgi:hypothetical protein
MLIDMVVHQPQSLVQVAAHTPYWVWGLLAALVALGVSQMRDRSAGLRRVLVVPAARGVFSVAGVVSAFGTSGQTSAQAVGTWLLAAAVITVLALWLQPTAPHGTRYLADERSFVIPGSAMPLALILGIFLTKYFVGVELALQPALARDSGFALQIAALYGVFSGLFAVRTLRLWRLAQHNASFGTAVGA